MDTCIKKPPAISNQTEIYLLVDTFCIFFHLVSVATCVKQLFWSCLIQVCIVKYKLCLQELCPLPAKKYVWLLQELHAWIAKTTCSVYKNYMQCLHELHAWLARTNCFVYKNAMPSRTTSICFVYKNYMQCLQELHTWPARTTGSVLKNYMQCLQELHDWPARNTCSVYKNYMKCLQKLPALSTTTVTTVQPVLTITCI